MGWSLGYDSHWDRDIGYGVPAVCDHPDCNQEIDRGLSYVCGGEAYGGDTGCGLFFCSAHQHDVHNQCERCVNEDDDPEFESLSPFAPKADVLEWREWKRTHESWLKWREENPESAAKLWE